MAAPDVTSVTDAGRASRPTGGAFPWAVAPGAPDDAVREARKRWYGGATFALLWQVLVVLALWGDGGSLHEHLMGSVGLGIVYLTFLLAPIVMWRATLRGRVLALSLFATLAFVLFGIIGPVVVWVWVLVTSLSGFVATRLWISVAINAVVVAAQLAVCLGVGWGEAINSGYAFSPVITVSVAASMLFFGRQRVAEQRLDVAQDEITRLAVVEERARFSRDLHDVLGHSLTVVTMKSELAAKLVDLDPERAKAELTDIERLSREALQGLRQAVSGYREADLDAELVAARAALSAAGIAFELPDDSRAAAPAVRSLFAWVLREGVTNVLRHSGAARVRVTLTRSELTVEDDGTGAGALDEFGDGNGLRGLRERADLVGASVSTGTSHLGGFSLRVARGGRR